MSATISITMVIGTMGLKLTLTNLDKLPTSFINIIIPVSQIKPSIADVPNMETATFKNRLKAPTIIVQEKREYWLLQQFYFKKIVM